MFCIFDQKKSFNLQHPAIYLYLCLDLVNKKQINSSISFCFFNLLNI